MPDRIDDNVREQIRTDYVLMGSVNKVAKKYKVSWATVKSILDEQPDELQQMRIDKRKEFIEAAYEVAQTYLERLKDPKLIKDVKARDAVIVYGTLVDKVQKEKELWLRFDEMWEQVYQAIKAEIRNEVKEYPNAERVINDMLEQEKLSIRNRAKEKFLTRLKDIKAELEEERKVNDTRKAKGELGWYESEVQKACDSVAKEIMDTLILEEKQKNSLGKAEETYAGGVDVGG